jgi:nicotinamide mononucleotide transporter
MDRRGVIGSALAWALLWLLCGVLLRSITDSDVAWADGFVTAGSIVGTVLLGRKFIENWPTWLVVNAASIGLFAFKGLVLTVALYVLFLGLAVWGWWGWSRRSRRATLAGSSV